MCFSVNLGNISTFHDSTFGRQLLSKAVRRRCSVKNVLLKCAEKHLCRSLFFNNVAGFRLETLLKKETPA